MLYYSSETRVRSLTDCSQIGFINIPNNQLLHGLWRETEWCHWESLYSLENPLHPYASYEMVARNSTLTASLFHSPSPILLYMILNLTLKWLDDKTRDVANWVFKSCDIKY